MHRTFYFPCLFALILSPCILAQAAQPNLQPGQWRYETTIRAEGDLPFMKDQSNTTTECLTREQIDEGDMFQEMDGSCEFSQQDIRADGMDYAARCAQGEQEVRFEGESRFMGERMEGTMVMAMETPMGPVTAHTDITGERIGDCR